MSYILFWAIIGALVATGVIGGSAAIAKAPSTIRKVKYNRRVAAVATLRAAAEEVPLTRSVDRLDVRNVQATGLTTPIDRYTFDLEIWWTEADGTARHYGPTMHVWPNDLATVPDNIVKEWATDLVTQAARWELGIDPEPVP